MRIGCLQFSPQVGDVDNNLNRADAVLSKANPQNLDLLVLPQLAFSGYNFRSLQHITPYLEPTISGITSLWARTTALKYDCVVTAGYPEKVDVSTKWPASPEYYSSAITVNADGETIANYRKSFLHPIDETWALEGTDGFFSGEIEGLGNVAMGICMDLNPHKFEAPWIAWEFAHHVLHERANIVILSMAWLAREDAKFYSQQPKEPDMAALSYWLARMEPVIRAEAKGEIICVFANRTGTEDEATYAGTSAVLGIHSGEVKVYGILGRGERELLVVDTNKRPQAKLVAEKPLASEIRQVRIERTKPKEPKEFRNLKGARDDGKYVRQSSAERSQPNNTEDSKATRDERKRNHEQSGKPSLPAPRGPAQSDMTPADHRTYVNSPTFHRPRSPKSRNASRSRDDLAPKEPIIDEAAAVPLSLRLAAAAVEPITPTNLFIPGSARTLSRSRSSVW